MATLTRVYTQTAAGNTTALAKRKMEDVNKRLGQLFERLNQNDISAQACDKLLHLCGGAFATALPTPCYVLFRSDRRFGWQRWMRTTSARRARCRWR